MYANRREREARNKNEGENSQSGSDYNRISQGPMEQAAYHGIPAHEAQPFDRYSQTSLPSQSHIQQHQTQPLMRPHLTPQDTRDSTAPLMSSPPLESPYTPSPADTITPAFPTSAYRPESAPLSTYFPSDGRQQALGQGQRPRIGSIPRRAVGSPSPV